MSSSVLVKRGRYEVPTSQTKKTVLCPVCNLAAREDYIKHRHLRSLIIWSNEDSNKPARKGTREYDGANAEQRSHTEYWSQHKFDFHRLEIFAFKLANLPSNNLDRFFSKSSQHLGNDGASQVSLPDNVSSLSDNNNCQRCAETWHRCRLCKVTVCLVHSVCEDDDEMRIYHPDCKLKMDERSKVQVSSPIAPIVPTDKSNEGPRFTLDDNSQSQNHEDIQENLPVMIETPSYPHVEQSLENHFVDEVSVEEGSGNVSLLIEKFESLFGSKVQRENCNNNISKVIAKEVVIEINAEKQRVKLNEEDLELWGQLDECTISCKPCAIYSTKLDVPKRLKGYRGGNFGQIKCNGAREQRKTREKMKDHQKNPLHQWCRTKYVESKNNTGLEAKNERKAATMVIMNALFALKEPGGGSNLFLKLCDKDDLNEDLKFNTASLMQFRLIKA